VSETVDRQGPLTSLKVLDLGVILAGPLCATFLGDLGADVVKVERPDSGDSMRGIGWKHPDAKDSIWWKIVGRNKRSVTMNLREEDGQEGLRRLAAGADVLIDGFRPGVMERWGCGWEELHQLNPKLVMCRVSGFGQTGPGKSRPGFGTLAEAMSGLAAVTGWPDTPPTLPAFGLADSIAGLTSAMATLAAIHERETVSGEGQMVDVALTEPLMALLGPQLPTWELLGIQQQRTGNRAPFVAPRGAYECSDGKWLALSGSTQETAARIFRAIGHPEFLEDPRFATNQDRLQNADALDEAIGAWTKQLPREQAIAALSSGEVAVAAVYDSADILADEHFQARESFTRIDDDELGKVVMPNIIARHSRTPGKIRHTGPSLDQDGHELESIIAAWGES
jgi:crotonobetainyl-CoA:carnitine CoA-transferase CaiB-like acyl-CoA transferase